MAWYWWVSIGFALALVLWYYHRTLLLSMMESRPYTWFLLRVFPYIRFGLYYTKIRGWQYNRGYKLLRPGMIILTRDNYKFSTLCIPGKMPHAALCVGHIDDGDDYEVAEMVAKGYTKSFFFDICHEADLVVILRCIDWDEDYTKKVVEKCRSFEGAPYDLQFEFGIASLYCSELVYQADFERRLKVDISDIAGIGRQYVAPTDILEAENVEVVWDSSLEVR